MTLILAAFIMAAAPPLGARLDVGVSVPFSSPQSTAFSVGPGGSLAFEFEVARFLDLEAQVGWLLLPRTENSVATGSGTLLWAGAGVRLRTPLDGNTLIPWGELLVNYGNTRNSALSLTGSIGLSIRPIASSGFLVGVFGRVIQAFPFGDPGPGLRSYSATVGQFGLSFEYLQSLDLEDRDQDGIPDLRDSCPDASAPDTATGCVEVAASDSDDRDHDGIRNMLDLCPDKAEDKDGYEDKDGCPEENIEPDADGDGVPDAVDQCKTTPGTKALRGCGDQDGDGVADPYDECPQVVGSADQKGCPQYKQVVVTELKIEIRQKIFFAFGITKILPKSDPLLSEVAQALRDRSGLCVRVEGHTDNQGKPAKNLTLSEGRAQAVLEALNYRGVATNRLEAKGYGSQLPIDNNRTLEGRENNRRVEFVIVPCRKDGP
jgi:outer membrane protein OmpA-like peptidoglycan-associated protein